MNTDIIDYYKIRAATYEKVYLKPERQEELLQATARIQEIFSGKKVLEIACGTGYWTERIAKTAQFILATDINETMLEIAQSKSYPKRNVIFQCADFYNFKTSLKYESLFGGFIWSHIKLSELENFIDVVSAFVQPGGSLVFMDNNYVEGSSLPFTQTDKDGNTYQTRLENESAYLVLKNFPSENSIRNLLAGKMSAVRFVQLKYYWIVVAQKL